MTGKFCALDRYGRGGTLPHPTHKSEGGGDRAEGGQR